MEVSYVYYYRRKCSYTTRGKTELATFAAWAGHWRHLAARLDCGRGPGRFWTVSVATPRAGDLAAFRCRCCAARSRRAAHHSGHRGHHSQANTHPALEGAAPAAGPRPGDTARGPARQHRHPGAGHSGWEPAMDHHSR